MSIDFPFLIFEATQSCNLDCRYCYNSWKRPGSPPIRKVSYSLARKTLGRLLRSTKVQQITFSGGEPLLLDGIEELVLHCRLKGKSVAIITNGTASKPGQYATLLGLGVSLFEIPIHSHVAAHHDFMTRSAGSWEKAVRSVEKIVGAGGDVVVVIVLCKPNIDDLPGTLAFIHDLGVRSIMVNRYNIGGKGISEEKNLLVTAPELRKAFYAADDCASALDLDITSNACTPFCIINPAEFSHLDFTSCVAGTPGGPITIDAFGDVRLCNHSPTVPGNIYRETLQSMISSEYSRKWTSTIPDDCIMCPLASRCRGGCRAAAEQCGLTLQCPDPILRLMGKAPERVPEFRKDAGPSYEG